MLQVIVDFSQELNLDELIKTFLRNEKQNFQKTIGLSIFIMPHMHVIISLHEPTHERFKKTSDYDFNLDNFWRLCCNYEFKDTYWNLN